VRDILGELRRWQAAGTQHALATVVAVSDSAPRPPGTSMAVDDTGEVVGSVSGGCVEGAVYDVAQSVLASGEPSLQTYGYSDDDAFAVGLTSGRCLSCSHGGSPCSGWTRSPDPEPSLHGATREGGRQVLRMRPRGECRSG